MKLAVHQPMVKLILHTEFHQNHTMGRLIPSGPGVIAVFGPNPFYSGVYVCDDINIVCINKVFKSLVLVFKVYF